MMDIRIKGGDDERVAFQVLNHLFQHRASNPSEYGAGLRITTVGGEVFDLPFGTVGGVTVTKGYGFYFERKAPVEASGYVTNESVVQKFFIPFADVATFEINPGKDLS